MKECQKGCYNDKMRVPYRTQKPWGLDTAFPTGGPRQKKKSFLLSPQLPLLIPAFSKLG